VEDKGYTAQRSRVVTKGLNLFDNKMRSGVGVTASMMQNGGGAGQIKLIFTLYEIFVSSRICIKNGMCGILVIKG
jgi:hypothetical protein